MPVIHLIAGPPGVGKTANAREYISPDLDIINEDDIRFKYKELGYPDFNEYSIHRTRETVRAKLIRNEDFPLELNLSYAHQWEYVLALIFDRFNNNSTINDVYYHH